MKFKTNKKEILSILTECNDKFLESSGLLVTAEAKVICPVDTGNLRRSIKHLKASNNSVQIGTDVDYAIDVEIGNSKQRSQPYLKPAGLNNKSKLVELARRVYGELN